MKTKILLLFGALALVVSGGAIAQTGIYGGFGIGKVKAKLTGSDFTVNTPGVEESRDEIDTVYKFFGGYQFSKYFGTELSYTDFGKFTYFYDAAAIAGGKGSVSYKANSWALSGVGSIPIGSRGFSAVGRLGVTYNTAERAALSGNFVPATPIPSAISRRLGLLWAVGGQYDFTPSLSLRLEFEDYGKFGEAQKDQTVVPQQTGRATIHMYSLNFIARF